MAIRPADLQLAYLAAPQNAALLNAAQEGPTAAQAASQAAFAAQVSQREETVAETARSERGSAIRANPDGGNGAWDQEPGKRRRNGGADAEDGAFELGDDEHFIDVTV
ncbi:MAG TPA: hypothetical protein VNF68_04270 [Candidatus Baltobacteraceae bacterium]|nr:hypothetical protein [Candidatus Baltobacteraceae bacterium]